MSRLGRFLWCYPHSFPAASKNWQLLIERYDFPHTQESKNRILKEMIKNRHRNGEKILLNLNIFLSALLFCSIFMDLYNFVECWTTAQVSNKKKRLKIHHYRLEFYLRSILTRIRYYWTICNFNVFPRASIWQRHELKQEFGAKVSAFLADSTANKIWNNVRGMCCFLTELI